MLLTPGARRAMDLAAAMAAEGEITPPVLLAALLAEPESRAARIVAPLGVDTPAVCQRWQLADPRQLAAAPSPVCPASRELESGFNQWQQRLADCPRPLTWATEDLLLAILLSDHPVAQWVIQFGLEVEPLTQSLALSHGYDSTPVEVDWYDPAIAPAPAREVAVAMPPPAVETAVWRILDASANRAGEALRVVEDYLRLALDDRHLTDLAKQLRHDLTAALAALPRALRLVARDTPGDVGTALTTSGERQRDDAPHVVAANFRRLAESLRSLEEYSKLIAPDAAARFEQLRYRGYTLERAAESTAGAIDRLADARLYVLLDGRDTPEQFDRLAQALIDAGTDVLQLRDKRLDDRRLLARARRLRELTRGTNTLLIVNDRPDLARLSAADGVHVGQDELTVAECRAIVGPQALIGVSTHNIEQARQAVVAGASYLGVGPMFPSSTKTFDQFPGLDFARQVAAEIRLPAFAIGGIGAGSLPALLATGIRRIALRGALLNAPDPAQHVRELKALLPPLHPL